MIADAFTAMASDPGRFGDGLLESFGGVPSVESRAASARLAHAINAWLSPPKKGR